MGSGKVSKVNPDKVKFVLSPLTSLIILIELIGGEIDAKSEKQ